MDVTFFNSASSAAPQILLLPEAVEIEPVLLQPGCNVCIGSQMF